MSRSLNQGADAAAASKDKSVDQQTAVTDADAEGEGDEQWLECASEADKRFWWLVSGVSGALAISAASFGAHGLRRHVTDVYYMDVWQMATKYHLTHSIVLALAPVVVGALRRQRARAGVSVTQQLRQTLGLARPEAGTGTVARRRSRAKADVRLRPYRNWSATLIASGGAIFCGSFYALVLTEQERPWAFIAPAGGFAIIAGWACMAVGL